MNEKQKSRFASYLALAVAGVLVFAAAIWAVFLQPEETPVDTSEGLAVLHRMAARSPDEVDEALRARELAAREEKLDALLAEDYNIWPEFRDYAVLGDSRAVGFSYYDFLDGNRVFAGGGDTIRNIADHMDELLALRPRYVYLCYGLNDVSIGYWDTAEEYAAEMAEVLKDLHEKLPDATLVVSSILPARDPAFEVTTSWYNIPAYSEAVGEICADAGAVYVDNTAICDALAEYWETDGIHVRPEFYPYWAKNLVVGALRHEIETDPS